MIDLESIRERASVATQGPWLMSIGRTCAHVVSENGRFQTGCIAFDGNGLANGEFIAHAREDVPALLVEVERLREALTNSEDSRIQIATFYNQMLVDLFAPMRGRHISRIQAEAEKLIYAGTDAQNPDLVAIGRMALLAPIIAEKVAKFQNRVADQAGER